MIEQRTALHDIRRLLAAFVGGAISVADFVPRYQKLFAPFDPPDLTAGGLTEAEKHQLETFIQLMGGWFGEEDDLIPKRADWVYGANTEPYAWIDEARYRQWIQERASSEKIDLRT